MRIWRTLAVLSLAMPGFAQVSMSSGITVENSASQGSAFCMTGSVVCADFEGGTIAPLTAVANIGAGGRGSGVKPSLTTAQYSSASHSVDVHNADATPGNSSLIWTECGQKSTGQTVPNPGSASTPCNLGATSVNANGVRIQFSFMLTQTTIDGLADTAGSQIKLASIRGEQGGDCTSTPNGLYGVVTVGTGRTWADPPNTDIIGATLHCSGSMAYADATKFFRAQDNSYIHLAGGTWYRVTIDHWKNVATATGKARVRVETLDANRNVVATSRWAVFGPVVDESKGHNGIGNTGTTSFYAETYHAGIYYTHNDSSVPQAYIDDLQIAPCPESF